MGISNYGSTYTCCRELKQTRSFDKVSIFKFNKIV